MQIHFLDANHLIQSLQNCQIFGPSDKTRLQPKNKLNLALNVDGVGVVCNVFVVGGVVCNVVVNIFSVAIFAVPGGERQKTKIGTHVSLIIPSQGIHHTLFINMDVI